MNLLIHYSAFCTLVLLSIVTLATQDCGNRGPSATRDKHTRQQPSPTLTANTQNTLDAVYGVTVDDIDNSEVVERIVASLKRFPANRKPTTRIVVDPEQVISENYVKNVARIHSVSNIMLLVADSYDSYKFASTEAYKTRLKECLVKLDKYVSIWEVGNEVNGQWAAHPRQPGESDEHFDERLEKELQSADEHQRESFRLRVKSLIEAGFHVLGDRPIALTLYLNDDMPEAKATRCQYPGTYCWPDICRDGINYGHQYETLTWLNKYIVSAGLKPTYLLISYYGDDADDTEGCGKLRMDGDKWEKVFKALHASLPNTKLGIGEIGAQCNDCKRRRNCCSKAKKDFIYNYYQTFDKRLKQSVPNYIGGYFYWYFQQDMVPSTKPELTDLLNAITSH